MTGQIRFRRSHQPIINLLGKAQAIALLSHLKLFHRATSLGGVESLIEHRATTEGPDTTTPDDLLRISVGLEHVDDLMADLAQGFERVVNDE